MKFVAMRALILCLSGDMLLQAFKKESIVEDGGCSEQDLCGNPFPGFLGWTKSGKN